MTGLDMDAARKVLLESLPTGDRKWEIWVDGVLERLALVQPVEGVVLTPEEAQRVLEWYGTSLLRAPEDRALGWMLAARLEAAQ